MAYVVNPQTGKVVEAQKKGASKNGEKQYWLDKKTKKRFTTDMGAEDYVDQTTKQILKTPKKVAKKVAKKSAPKKKAAAANGKKKTIIKVNGNEIKKQKGILSNDDAFDLVSDYFRELTKTNVTRKTTKDGDVVVEFQVRTGRKG